ncbi:hypothetical protein SAMN02745248_01037 [Hathewaya proteolytica DSM 3090]|uniref:Uncharacterized protein n=1 Tax=Hathewaya proteolytica DSM 3090 TaxID=1121331 RepID=A0A1M6MFM7_9CLOT|nr:hypothetical protein [Hathewaya proteolytica]SHJ82248.1 hypothetical protein SAMN02745248_01037 [Hathewaya proteolytica DSM 3090]
MLKRITVNLEAIEMMNFFWEAASHKENVSEQFFAEVGAMPAMTCIYDDEFTSESVRRTLSAIKNREPFSGTQKEKRYWNYNMWIMEDLEYKNSMIQPVKKLNFNHIVEKLQGLPGADKYEELQVIFSPMNMDEYLIKENKLLINFFMVRPADIEGGNVTLLGRNMDEYVEEKLKELLSK